jgi:hypothetical protein
MLNVKTSTKNFPLSSNLLQYPNCWNLQIDFTTADQLEAEKLQLINNFYLSKHPAYGEARLWLQ